MVFKCLSSPRWFIACCILLVACGKEPESTDPVPNEDAGFDAPDAHFDASDVDDDAHAPDTQADTVLDPDGSVDEPDAETDIVLDPSVPAVTDYTLCASDLDCPINGSRCVIYLPYNRPDAEGIDEVLLSEVFNGLEGGQGVCSRPCSNDPTVCGSVLWPDDRGTARPSTCVVVATGASPYAVESLEPFIVTVDLNAATDGQAFGALCMPPFQHHPSRAFDFCKSCEGPNGCSADSVCFNMLSGAPRANSDELGQSFCLEPCAEESDCSLGFSCVASPNGQSYCTPDTGTCSSCIDHDQDGYGTGHCGPASARQTPYDCDDSNPLAFYNPRNLYHSFPAHCGAFDYNCDGLRDDLQQVGTEAYGAHHCTSCGDTCAGTVDGGTLYCRPDASGAPACAVGCAPGWSSCGGDPVDGCPIAMDDPEYLYFQDADEDGFGDRVIGAHFFCTPEEAALNLTNPIHHLEHPADAQGNLLLDCDDADDETYPGAPNPCNGKDNSCSGRSNDVDPNVLLVGTSCVIDRPGVHGVCTAGQNVCRNDAGQWGLYCNQVVFPGTHAEVCDGVDNNCSGTIDDVPGIDDACDTGLLGQCATGRRVCEPTATGVDVGLRCAQTVFPTLEQPGFDGIDHSCDGFDRYGRPDGSPHAVYVQANLTNTLQGFIDQAASANCRITVAGQNVQCDVFLQGGSHFATNTVSIRSGVDVYGGIPLDQNAWRVGPDWNMPVYAGSSPPTVIRSSRSSGAVLGLHGVAIWNPTHLYGIRIETANVNMDDDARFCASNVGFFCDDCPLLRLKNFVAQAGAAGPGRDGQNGYNGDAGNPGNGGGFEFWHNMEWWHVPGGGSWVGYNGGRVSCTVAAGNCPDPWTMDGSAGLGPRGGAGGTWGDRRGKDGGGGVAVDQQGSSVTHYGTLSGPNAGCTRNHWGTQDWVSHGSGGGGSYVNEHWTWYYGASGGGGGRAGGVGEGGASGAASIGMMFQNTAGRVEMNNVIFRGGPAGQGGQGGQGGRGGAGGNGAHQSHPITEDAYGGGGGFGAGGNGGFGGNGGVSIGLFLYHSSLGTTQDLFVQAGLGGQAGQGGLGGQPADGNGTSSDTRKGANGHAGSMGRQGLTCSRYDTTDAWPITLTQAGCIN
jgi:hypothetical protein